MEKRRVIDFLNHAITKKEIQSLFNTDKSITIQTSIHIDSQIKEHSYIHITGSSENKLRIIIAYNDHSIVQKLHINELKLKDDVTT